MIRRALASLLTMLFPYRLGRDVGWHIVEHQIQITTGKAGRRSE